VNKGDERRGRKYRARRTTEAIEHERYSSSQDAHKETMTEGKEEPSSSRRPEGLRRGFLLGSSKQKSTKRQPKSSSSALLNLKESGDPLFVVKDDIDEKRSTKKETMAQEKEEPSPSRRPEGLRRGFLLGSSKQKKSTKRRPKSSSSALLSLEESGDPLFVVKDDIDENKSTRKSPSIISLDFGTDDDDRRLAEIKTTKRQNSSFILDVEETADDRVVVSRDGSTDDIYQTVTTEEETISEPVGPCPSWLMEESPEKEQEEVVYSCSTVVKKEYSTTLCRLGRKNETNWREIGSTFISGLQSPEDWTCIWNFIVDSTADFSGSSLPQLRLGVCLMDRSLNPLLSCLQYSTDEQQRRRILGCVAVLQFYLLLPVLTQGVALVDQVVPELVRISSEAGSKRTVLAQRAMDIAVEIISLASLRACEIDCTSGQQDLVVALCRRFDEVDRLLDIQLKWTDQPSREGSSFFSFEGARNHCKATILADWKDISAEYKSRFGSGRDASTCAEAFEIALRWCKHLNGRVCQGCSTQQIGSLSQTLTSRYDCKVEAIVCCLEQAVESIQSCTSGPASSEAQDYVRALTRGVVSGLRLKGKRLLPAISENIDKIEESLLKLLIQPRASTISIALAGL
jgi:hypothetical protein